jgi:predicted MFS family arabinose efflux permease
VGRGTLLMAGTTLAVGFAMAAQQNIVSNYFEDELGLSGSQFGYITAIREIPGFLLIFLTALFYRLSLPRLTALALVVLAIGYGFFGLSDSFWTVAPWVILSSMGYHTWLQTQSAMSMSLVRESHSGSILGRMAAVNQGGALLAMLTVFLVFQFDLLSYTAVFALCGALALVGALLIFTFPNLRDGEVQSVVAKREPVVFRKEYRLYYLLSVLDGARQQICFSLGRWVLVNNFGLDGPAISAVMVAVTILSMLTGPRIGRMLDEYGERRMLRYVNIGYVVALLGYGLIDNVAVAILCYVIYSFIMPLSAMGASTYLRKIAPTEDVAPSLAMGVTMQHAAAVVVPIAAGFILNYVGYQVPFLIAVGFALLALPVTQRLRPELQKSARRLAQDSASAAVVSPAPRNSTLAAETVTATTASAQQSSGE